jgi:hypothetical protein
MQKMESLKFTVAALALSVLSACGGGGSSTPVTKTGYFIDSAVAGLEYTSGSTTGITGADGSFQYEEGKPVTFKIGNLVLGSLTVTNSRVFPVDLISGATDETHPKVSLMAQILQTLDSDGDASNGITITEASRQAITQAIEIATADPTQTTAAINQLLANATQGRSTVLISQSSAENHLKANLIKEFQGAWTGSYLGSSAGPCQANISSTGRLTGTCSSNGNGNTFSISGQLSSSGQSSVAGSAGTGSTFEGAFTRDGRVSGTWVNANYSNFGGTWTMTKQ